MEQFKMVMSLLGMLIVMLGVFYGAYWVSKQVGKKYQQQASAAGRIEILARSVIGKEQMLLIVKSADKTLLIGATADNITLLSELDGEKLPELEQPLSPQVDFMSVLKTAWNDRKGTAQNGGDCPK